MIPISLIMTYKCNIIYNVLKSEIVFLPNFWLIPQNQVLLYPEQNRSHLFSRLWAVFGWMASRVEGVMGSHHDREERRQTPKRDLKIKKRGSNGGMVDTRDLKSLGLYRLCGFESRFEHSLCGLTEKTFVEMVGVRILRSSVLALLLLGAQHVSASDYRFNLYLGLGPVRISAGTAHLYDTEVIYEGRAAIRTAMEMSTNSTADKVFALRDTIESFNTKAGESLYFRKTVNEGSKHNVETASFSKDRDKFIVNLTTMDMNTGQRTGHSTEWRPTRIFDLMSMIAFTQGFDTSDSEPGRTETLPMVNGNMVVQQYLVYTGNKKVKADNGRTYDCMVISIRDYKEGKERETVKAYVTNDSKHTPIQLDIILGTGTSIKAVLK